MNISEFSNRFSGHLHVILPVIHVETLDQAVRNAHVVKSAGCDGVFLINHSISSEDLVGIARHVRSSFPNLWVGVNLMQECAQQIQAAARVLVVGTSLTVRPAGCSSGHGSTLKKSSLVSNWIRSHHLASGSWEAKPQPGLRAWSVLGSETRVRRSC